MRHLLHLIIIALFSAIHWWWVASASSQNEAKRESNTQDKAKRIAGVWMRSIAGRPEAREGLCFDADGRFGLLGIHSMHGLTWRIEGDTLIVTTNTERYPEPQESKLGIESLQDSLALRAKANYLGGAYRRDDNAAGRLTGVVTYRQRIALPPNAAIYLELREVSRQGIEGKLIAAQTIPTAGRQVPIPFRLYYASSDIDSQHQYALNATITVNGERRFITTTSYPVLTAGNPSTDVEIVVVPFSK